MNQVKKTLTILGVAFAILGVVLFIVDWWTCWRYGFDMNEVAGVTDAGEPIDWPTGERPLFAMVPLLVYILALWAIAAAALWLRRFIKAPYVGRIIRGTE